MAQKIQNEIDPKKVKIAMIQKDIRLCDLAKKMQVTPSAVHQVIHGNAKSKRISKEIENILNDWGCAV